MPSSTIFFISNVKAGNNICITGNRIARYLKERKNVESNCVTMLQLLAYTLKMIHVSSTMILFNFWKILKYFIEDLINSEN